MASRSEVSSHKCSPHRPSVGLVHLGRSPRKWGLCLSPLWVWLGDTSPRSVLELAPVRPQPGGGRPPTSQRSHRAAGPKAEAFNAALALRRDGKGCGGRAAGCTGPHCPPGGTQMPRCLLLASLPGRRAPGCQAPRPSSFSPCTQGWGLASIWPGSLSLQPLHLLLVLLDGVLDPGVHHGLGEDPVLRGIGHGLEGEAALRQGTQRGCLRGEGVPDPPGLSGPVRRQDPATLQARARPRVSPLTATCPPHSPAQGDDPRTRITPVGHGEGAKPGRLTPKGVGWQHPSPAPAPGPAYV